MEFQPLLHGPTKQMVRTDVGSSNALSHSLPLGSIIGDKRKWLVLKRAHCGSAQLCTWPISDMYKGDEGKHLLQMCTNAQPTTLQIAIHLLLCNPKWGSSKDMHKSHEWARSPCGSINSSRIPPFEYKQCANYGGQSLASLFHDLNDLIANSSPLCISGLPK